jgi:RNA polymerase sigma-70 factor, ECF subfamily
VYRRDRVNLETAYCTRATETMAVGPDFLDPHSQFISKHLRRIFVQIYGIVRNAADAQDLTQETFIKALRHRDQLRDEQKAAHWLSRIATNAAIDFVRRNNRTAFAEIDDARRTHDDNPERILMRAQTRAYLDAGLRLLTPRERAALLLRDVEGLPAEEVARRLNCSQATVRSHIAHSRVKLRDYMDRAGAEAV